MIQSDVGQRISERAQAAGPHAQRHAIGADRGNSLLAVEVVDFLHPEKFSERPHAVFVGIRIVADVDRRMIGNHVERQILRSGSVGDLVGRARRLHESITRGD